MANLASPFGRSPCRCSPGRLFRLALVPDELQALSYVLCFCGLFVGLPAPGFVLCGKDTMLDFVGGAGAGLPPLPAAGPTLLP
jgi:hypothetical protein